jgi:hypothetical protein
MKNLVFCISGIFIYSVATNAGSNDHYHHKAHVHGIAEMTLALEKNKLEIVFESPADNIVGFEQKASTPEQERTVKKARDVLSAPHKLFLFAGATCVLTHHHVNVSSILDDEGGHHDHKSHKESHSEIKAEYHFDCKEGDKLKSISVGLLDAFSGIEKLNVMWVTDGKQGSARLNKSAKTIDLNQ